MPKETWKVDKHLDIVPIKTWNIDKKLEILTKSWNIHQSNLETLTKISSGSDIPTQKGPGYNPDLKACMSGSGVSGAVELKIHVRRIKKFTGIYILAKKLKLFPHTNLSWRNSSHIQIYNWSLFSQSDCHNFEFWEEF